MISSSALRLQLVGLPFARRGRAVPHHGGGDRRLGGEHQRMPAGLAVAHDDDLARVGGLVGLQRRQRGAHQLVRFRIGHVVAAVAGVEHLLVRMLVEEIRRQHREAVARAAHRLVLGVLHQPVALVHQDDGREFPAAGRIGEERRHAVGAGDVLGGDVDMAGGDGHRVLLSTLSTRHQLHGVVHGHHPRHAREDAFQKEFVVVAARRIAAVADHHDAEVHVARREHR